MIIDIFTDTPLQGASGTGNQIEAVPDPVVFKLMTTLTVHDDSASSSESSPQHSLLGIL